MPMVMMMMMMSYDDDDWKHCVVDVTGGVNGNCRTVDT